MRQAKVRYAVSEVIRVYSCAEKARRHSRKFQEFAEGSWIVQRVKVNLRYLVSWLTWIVHHLGHHIWFYDGRQGARAHRLQDRVSMSVANKSPHGALGCRAPLLMS